MYSSLSISHSSFFFSKPKHLSFPIHPHHKHFLRVSMAVSRYDPPLHALAPAESLRPADEFRSRKLLDGSENNAIMLTNDR